MKITCTSCGYTYMRTTGKFFSTRSKERELVSIIRVLVEIDRTTRISFWLTSFLTTRQE